MPEVRRPVAFLILGVLCAQFLVLGLIQASRDSVTIDEAIDLTAGLVAIENRDLRMLPEHALALPVLAGVLPTLVANPVVPDTPAYEEGDWFDYTDDLIRANDEAGRLDRVVFWFRVVPLCLGLLSGVLAYSLGARLVNRPGGLVAAGLWLTTPYVLGLAHVGSLDVSFTCSVLVLALTLDRWRAHRTEVRVVALAAALGGALLSRHTALVLVPAIIVIAVVSLRHEDRRTRLRQLGMVLVIPLIVVWTAYRIVDPVPVDGEPRARFEALIDNAAASGPAPALALSVPMPVEWRAGFAYLVETSEPRPAFLLGDSWFGGRPWYFPLSAAVKVPLTASLAVIAAAIAWFGTRREERRRAAAVLGVPAVALALFLVSQPLNIGLRLALPVIALAFVSTASIGRLRPRLFVPAVLVVLAGQVTATTLAHPTSLAWTPPPFGDGYRVVSDGTLDLGQANGTVRDRHRTTPFVAATLTAPRGYEVLEEVPRIQDLAADQLLGDVVVSAGALTVRDRDVLSWLRAYCPVEVIDSSVLVYRFDEPPDVAPGPATPASPCTGRFSTRT